MAYLIAGSRRFSLARPLVMGIVNVTPDSFSDGGRHAGAAAAIAHGLALAEAGADLLDVGGESTRPGAAPVKAADEIARVLPVVEALAGRGLAVSIDTHKPAVMRVALDAGAVMVNDVRALRDEGALEVVAASTAAVCLMHLRGEPRTMQEAPEYADVLGEVKTFLAERAAVCEAAGIGRERIVIDPGFGFGKALDHNLALLARLDEIVTQGYPVLAGLSRKSMLGALTGRGVGEREFAGIAAHLAAVARGARLLRVHDVAAARDALAVWDAVEENSSNDA